MPFFRALCEVSGFRVDTGIGVLAGYYCTVVFHCPDDEPTEIGKAARQAVQAHDAYRRVLQAGAAPDSVIIRVDDHWRINKLAYFWRRFIRPDKGATWYPPEA